METKITIVVDNVSAEGIQGEWGLSVFIMHNGKKILLDAGSSDLFLENMKKLGINVAEIDHAVLSHAHYDHANGMPAFFENNKTAKLYLREQTAADCYAKKFLFKKYIGIPRKMLSQYPDRIEMISGDYKLAEGVWILPHKTKGLDSIGKRELMYRKTPNGWIPDDFSHEQSLVLDTDKGLLILNSCSHGGAANIITEVQKKGSLEDFWKNLPQLDADFNTRLEKLNAENKRWRFVAKLENGKTSVELCEIENGHPFYNLKGSNNIVLLTTERYKEFPMLIQGYGAGASVTAAGVFANIMSIANI